MRLKELEFFGFKSFAEKVVLNFNSDIVGLVGPNGCGKSNIVDAILWVLGEQSAKSLRAERMQDVLFAGAEDVKPANFAEVSLTLAEVENCAGGEVTVSRRLYRDGETQYLINRKESRLKDVQDLFLGTGSGKNAFFVFEQGKIDEIINMSPERRKAIFSETAGISRFIQRKKEAMGELTEVEKNYHRLKDIHGEIERQLRILQKQAIRAKNYQERKEQLQHLEKNLVLFKTRELFLEITQIESFLDKLSQLLCEAEDKVAHLDKNLADMKSREEDAEKEKRAWQSQLLQIENRHNVIKVELCNNEESVHRLEQREKKALVAKERLLLLQEEKKQERGKLLAELVSLEEHKKIAETQRHSRELEELSLEKENTFLLAEEKKTQKDLLDAIQKENAITSKIQEKILKKEASSRSLTQSEMQLHAYKQSIVDLEDKIGQRRAEIEKILFEIEGLKKEMSSFEESENMLKKKIALSSQEKENVHRQVTEVSAHIKALEHVKRAQVGLSQGTKALLKEASDTHSELFGRLEELYKYVEIKEGIEKQCTHAFRFYQETLVVKEKTDLDTILSIARKKKISDFSLIFLEDLNKEFFQSGDKAVLAAKNLKDGFDLKQKHPEGEILTDEGFFIDRQGVIFFFAEKTQNSSVFIRENEIKKWQKESDRLQVLQVDIAKEHQKLLSELKKIEEKKFHLSEKRSKREISLVQENFYLQRTLEDVNRLHNSIKKGEEEIQKQVYLINDWEEELKNMRSSHAEFAAKRRKAEEVAQQLEYLINEKKTVLEEKMRLSIEAKKNYDQLLFQFYSFKEKIKILDVKGEEEKREYERLRQEISESIDIKASFFAKQEKLEQEKRDAKEEKDRISLSLSHIDNFLKQQKAQKKECEQEIVQEKKKIREAEKEKHHKDLLLAEKMVSFSSYQKQLFEHFHLHWDNVKNEDVLFDMPPQEAEETIIRLRYELESQSPINLAAIEECEQQQKRFKELDDQLKDIQAAKEDLEKIIEKLHRESSRLFKSTFEQVRKNFQKNFQILFQGGEADLTFTQEEELLERGVEIIARPPGKKMRSLLLLSGGEKCLTTVALLFALFEVKPAPFCILDEVDAPLDEANVQRFTALLQEFVSKTQFIIVTHNKKTMAACDILVGVSMEKRGVSKLLNLKFIHPKQPEKALC